MTHAIRFHKTGGPEVLVWEGVTLGKPGPGEAKRRPLRPPTLSTVRDAGVVLRRGSSGGVGGSGDVGARKDPQCRHAAIA